VENVLKFMKNAPVKLLGYKKLQYILWIKTLRTIPRYAKKLTIPNNY
jgi:ubiquinol-cytochrome c reductase cytochrome b subunit